MEKERTKCLIYTRVMWYLSPTYRYNVGKKSEFYSRKYFSKEKAGNHNYIDCGSSCSSLEFVWEHFKVVSDMVLNNREFIKQYI